VTNADISMKFLARAQDDLLVARHVFEDLHPKKMEISCYQSQQAGEKALKAYLLFKQQEPPFTHNLGLLCRLCADIDDAFDAFADDCTDLTPYATQARYPGNKEFTEEETESALRKAERIVQFCAINIVVQ